MAKLGEFATVAQHIVRWLIRKSWYVSYREVGKFVHTFFKKIAKYYYWGQWRYLVENPPILSSYPQYFQYISYKSQIKYSFVKCGWQIFS